jgi:hypothetical protein
VSGDEVKTECGCSLLVFAQYAFLAWTGTGLPLTLIQFTLWRTPCGIKKCLDLGTYCEILGCHRDDLGT